MPFKVPTISEIGARIVADFDTRVEDANARLPLGVIPAQVAAHAAATRSAYDFIGYLGRQILPDMSDTDWLERHASLRDVTRHASVSATGTVMFTGVETSIVPAGTSLRRSDDVEYTTAADVTITGGTADATVNATVPGYAGNVAGGTLTLVNAIAGIDVDVEIGVGGLTGGTDTESDERFLARLLFKMRNPPMWGSAQDYIRWVLDTPTAGATRAWIIENYGGIGGVGVTFVRDDDPVSIIPGAPELAAVETYIRASNRKPPGGYLFVFAPIAHTVNFTVDLTPDTATTRAAVEASLRQLLRKEGSLGNDILHSHIEQAISNSIGVTDRDVTVPSATVAIADNEIAIFGAITWL